MNKITQIKDLYAFLLGELRPKKPVILRFSNKMIYHGSYSYFNNKHCITLNKKDNLQTSIDNLIHEFAHVLEHNKYSCHTDAWGIKYAKVYRAYLEWSGN